MRLTTLVVLGAISCFGSVNAASAGCARDLVSQQTTTAPSLLFVLPAACRAMGPIHLGMSTTQMIKVLGEPDAEASGRAGYSSTVYVFPRDLAVHLRKKPEPSTYFWAHVAFLRVVLDHNTVVGITSYASRPGSLPYAVGDITPGEPVAKLLHEVKTPVIWNASRDNIVLGSYPIEVTVDDQRINGITIATSRTGFSGLMPAWQQVTDPVTGLVRDYRVWLQH